MEARVQVRITGELAAMYFLLVPEIDGGLGYAQTTIRKGIPMVLYVSKRRCSQGAMCPKRK